MHVIAALRAGCVVPDSSNVLVTWYPGSSDVCLLLCRKRDAVLDGQAYTMTLASVAGWKVKDGGDPPGYVLLGKESNPTLLAAAQEQAWSDLKAVAGNELPQGCPDLALMDVFCAFVLESNSRAKRGADVQVDAAAERKRTKLNAANEQMTNTVIDAVLAKIRQEHNSALKAFLHGGTIPKRTVLVLMLQAADNYEFPRSEGVRMDTCTPYRLETGVITADETKSTVNVDKDDGITVSESAKVKSSKSVKTPDAFRDRFTRLIFGMYFVAISLDDAGSIRMKKTPGDRGFQEGRDWVTFDSALNVVNKVSDLFKLGMTVDQAYAAIELAINEARMYMNGDEHGMVDDRPTLGDAFAYMVKPDSHLQYMHRQLSNAKTEAKGGNKPEKSVEAVLKGLVTKAVDAALKHQSPGTSPAPTPETKEKKKKKKDRKTSKPKGGKGKKKVDFSDGGDEDSLDRKFGGNARSSVKCKRPQYCKDNNLPCRFLCWKTGNTTGADTSAEEDGSESE